MPLLLPSQYESAMPPLPSTITPSTTPSPPSMPTSNPWTSSHWRAVSSIESAGSMIMWADVVSIEPMGELDEECTRLLSMLRQIEKHTTTAIMAYTEAHWRFEQWWMQYQIDVKLRCLLESFDTYGQAYIATCFGISVQELRMREQEYVHQKESKLGLLDDTRAWAKHLVNHEGYIRDRLLAKLEEHGDAIHGTRDASVVGGTNDR